MQITNISGRNVKGVPFFSHDLESLTLFTGKNHVGKTARLDALKLAILQFHPDLSKSPNSHKAHFQLASGPNMECSATVSDGQGKYSAYVKLSQKKVNGPIKHDNKPLPESIFDGKVGGMALDPLSYFALGPTERMRYVFDRVKMPEGFSVEAIDKRIGSIKIEVDEDTEEDLKDWLYNGNWVNEGCASITNPQDFIETTIQNMFECAKAVKLDRSQQEQCIQELAEQSLDDISGGNAEKLQGDLNSLKAAHDELIAEKTRLEATGTIEAYDEAQATIGLLTEELAEIPEHDIEALRESKKELEESIDEKEYLELCNKGSVSQDLLTACVELKSKCEQWRNEMNRLRRQLEELEETDNCEYCGASEDGWKTKMSDVIKNRLHELSEELKPISMERFQKDKEYADALKESEEARKKNELTELTRNNIRAYEAAINGAKGYDLDRKNILKDIEESKAVRSPDEEKINATKKAISDNDEKQSTIDNTLRMLEVARNNRKNMLTANEKLETIVCRETLVAEIRKELKTIQSEMVTAVFEGVLKPANVIAKGFFKGPIEYRDEEIGYVHPKNGKFIITKLWDGTEKALGFAAIGVGLASMSKVRVLVIDELLRLHPESFNMVLTRIEEALKTGLIDQFIGIAPTLDNLEVSDAFNVIEIKEG